MKVMGVYKITCLCDGKIYIGSTNNYDKRRKEHWRLLKGKYHTNPHLQNAWGKYGKKSFTIELIENVTDENKLVEREQYWIDKTKCCDRKIGFNISPTAGGTYGYQYTEEQKKNCSKWVRSEECRNKIRIARAGTKTSFEARKKQSESHKGNKNPMFGKTRSEDVRRKISESRIKNGVGRGNKHNKAKLNNDDIKEIRKLFEDGNSATEIAKIYNVSKSTTSRINKGLLWSHVEG